MTNQKKYFWLKFKEDFFNQKEIKKLRKIAGGDTYTIIYLKMQLKAIKTNGILQFEGLEETFYEEIALDLDEDVENVKVTIAFLMSHKLLEQISTDEYMLPRVLECIGSETASASRVRKHRANLKNESAKLLQCNEYVTKCNTEIDIEKDIELDTDIKYLCTDCSKEISKNIFERYNNKCINCNFEGKFNIFWNKYPKKVSKEKARKAFFKINFSDVVFSEVLKSLDKFINSKEWQKDNGQYIPYPATWLNQKRWEDETIDTTSIIKIENKSSLDPDVEARFKESAGDIYG